MKTHNLIPEIFYYTFGPHSPELIINSGDIIIAETCNAYSEDKNGAAIPLDKRQTISGTTLYEANPCVGPICIEEARQGDVLAVEIIEIQITSPKGKSRQTPNFGSLTGETPGHSLLYNPPIEKKSFIWDLDLENKTGRLQLPDSKIAAVEVPFNPFLGTIGVAPPFGIHKRTLNSGEFGGNMDCVETKQGTTVYFPVFCDGAYLFFGDIHAIQGDGELCGSAVEATANVSLKISVIKNKRIQWPRMEDDQYIMTIGNTRPLMDAVRLAQIELLDWLVSDFGFTREDAWQLNSQVGTMRIGNVVDPSYSVVARFPKRYLP